MLDYHNFVEGARKIGLICLSFKEEEGKYINNKELIERLESETAKVIEIRNKHRIEIIMINIDKKFYNFDIKSHFLDKTNIDYIEKILKNDQIANENKIKSDYDIGEERREKLEERREKLEETEKKLRLEKELKKFKLLFYTVIFIFII